MRIILGALVTALLFPVVSFSQSAPSQINFRAPVDFPMRLSGTFGEWRSGHFHAGIDIKTYEQTGKAVRMIADGHISRIKIRTGGYGKAIYITHNNGYTSVYAHLKTFNRTINNYIRKLQLKKKSYEIDISVPEYRLYYNKGDIIAYTGNSGYSMGPHLHFEIRETKNQRPVNPLYFGFDIPDDIPPTLLGMKVYQNENKFAHAFENEYDLEVQDGKYRLKSKSDTLKVKGKVSFGIGAFDKLNDTPNPDGVYKIRLLKNDTAVFTWTADRFSFYETRYINSFIDYGEYVESGKRYARTRIDPHNRLSMYEISKDKGQYSIPADSTVRFEYQVSDYFGNTSSIGFFVKGMPNTAYNSSSPLFEGDSLILKPSKNYNFKLKDLSIEFPGRSFYRNTVFHVNKKTPDSIKPYPLYSIGSEKEPVHRYFTFKTDNHSISDSLLHKAVWGRYDDEDGFKPISSQKEGAFLVGVTRNFGLYSIRVDTVAPSIELLGFKENDTISKKDQNKLTFKIKDELSGISDYDVYINDKWVIAAYDAKNDLLTYHFDEFLELGKNRIKIKLEDLKSNIYEKNFELLIKK